MDNTSLFKTSAGLTARTDAGRARSHRWLMLSGLLIIALIAAVWLSGQARAMAGLTPVRVYGQPSFTSDLEGMSATNLSKPVGVASDSSGGIYVADSFNDRVLHFPAGSTTADRVYGQSNFTSDNPAGNTNALSLPGGVVTDSSGGLYVADTFNNRILHFPAGSTVADRVYGQPDFTSHTSGTSATSMFCPWGLKADSSGGLYVADSFNNRVLHFPAGSTTADRVYGQPDFTSHTSGTSATNLASPWDIALDNTGGIYVADRANSRVLHFPAGSTTADRIYGQPDFAAHNQGMSATSFNDPRGIALDLNGGLYVADSSNNRVLHFPAGSTIADQVYGQPDFTSHDGSVGQYNLNFPDKLSVDSQGGLYVADDNNNRVLYYGAAQVTNVALGSISGEGTTTNTPFSHNLIASVLDGFNKPVSGVVVTFTAPSSGASGTFVGGSTVYTGTTNANGNVVSPVFTTNSTVGSYAVTASAGVVVTSYWITNFAACSQLLVTSTLDDGSCGTLRNAVAIVSANNSQTVTVTINLSAGSVITLTKGLMLPNNISITTTASCSSVPPVIIQGVGAQSGNGIVLGVNDKLANLWIRGFSGTQLVAPMGSHATLRCVKASKS